MRRLSMLFVALALFPLCGCGQKQAVSQEEAAPWPDGWVQRYSSGAYPEGDIYRIPDSQLATLAPVETKVLVSHPCDAVLRTRDGRMALIGGPVAALDVQRYARTLKKGDTCRLPDDYLAFVRRQREEDAKATERK